MSLKAAHELVEAGLITDPITIRISSRCISPTTSPNPKVAIGTITLFGMGLLARAEWKVGWSAFIKTEMRSLSLSATIRSGAPLPSMSFAANAAASSTRTFRPSVSARWRSFERPSIPTPRVMSMSFVSLGCPKNLVDSEKMLGLLAESGLTPEQREHVELIRASGENGRGMALAGVWLGGLSILATIARADISQLIARRDRGIVTTSDLKGRRIGVTRTSVGEFLLSHEDMKILEKGKIYRK